MSRKPTNKELEQKINYLEQQVAQLNQAKQELTGTLDQLEQLLEVSSVAIYRCEPRGNYPATFVSKNVKGQLGYEPQEFTEDPDFWANHIHPEDVRRVLDEVKSLFEKSYHSHQYRFLNKDGNYRWMYDELRLVYDAEGNPATIIGNWTDITELKRAEEALKEKEAELEIKAKNLEEVNTALRVLLKGRQEDKGKLEEKVRSNVKDLVLPYLEKLKKTSLDATQISCISILESNLNEIISPFAHRLSSKYLALTPTEIRVADLVKGGKNTKEIAEFMNLSSKTIQSHRDNIRKKFGIKHKKTNLRSYLSLLG